jgi:hypothetical protein
MNLTPKKDFQGKKQFADAHRELVVSTPFREALHAALIDQVMDLRDTHDPVVAAAEYQRIMGARGFIVHLLNIAEIPKTPPTTPTANLDHSIR